MKDDADVAAAPGSRPPAHVHFECPDCGIPVYCSEQHWAEDYEAHLNQQQTPADDSGSDPDIPTDSDDEFDQESDDPKQDLIDPTTTTEPQSFKEAMESPERDQWKEATDAETNQLLENRTWNLFET